MSPMYSHNPNCHFVEWSSLANRFKTENLSFLTINIRSLPGKFSEFVAHLNMVKHKFTFIVVVETWLSEWTDLALDIEGYKSYSLYREDQVGGGIKIFYSDFVTASIIECITSSSGACESLFLKANIPGALSLTVGAIYRPPHKSVNEFCHFMDNAFELVGNGRLVVLGDFNINSANEISTTHNYIDLFHQYGLVNEINLPTYCSPATSSDGSCIDHIWHNLHHNSSSYVIYPNLSDHYAVCSIFSQLSTNIPKKFYFRDFSSSNIQKFVNNIETEFSTISPPMTSVNDYSNCLSDSLFKIMNKYFPIRSKTISINRLKSPWITTDIRACIEKKHKWYRMFRRGDITNRSYGTYVKCLRKLLVLAHEKYYENRLNSLNHDVKRNWNVLNKLLGRKRSKISDHFVINGSKSHCPDKISNAFCDHFISHPATIHASILPSTSDYSNLISPTPNSMVLHYVTENEVKQKISLLKKEGSISDISRRFLRLCVNYVSKYICFLFNFCIDEATFPDKFKIAKISPIFKKGPQNLIINYRPIASLCNINKLFESILHARLTNYFASFELLAENQFGFRKDRNTELAIFELLNKLLPAIEAKKYAVCVFLDYSACFDTLSRDVLYDKLDKYGIRGNTLNLFKSYFSDRLQYVNYEEVSSYKRYQNLGVIQGSKLGPLFFDVYSSDFCELCRNDNSVLYADDTSLVYVGDNIEALLNHVNSRLSIIFDWCNFNKLSLNPTKSEFMILTNKKIISSPDIYIGQSAVKRVKCFKYLGISIDDDLKFHSQIKIIENKLSQFCGITYRLHKFFNFRSSKNVYYACIYSVISYCIAVWGGVTQCTSRCNRLDNLHKRIIKNLFHKYFSAGGCLFKAAKILKLGDIFRLRVGIYMYKICNTNSVPTLKNALDLHFPDHDYSTRGSNTLVVPFPRVESIRINFKYQFVKVWNDVPENIKASESIAIFKNSLKQHFLNSY